jgi:cell division protein FtsB
MSNQRKLENSNSEIRNKSQKSEAKIRTMETENTGLKAQVADLRSQLTWLQAAVARLAGKSAGSFALNPQPQDGK